MSKPVRLQLKRTKGFDLQALSMATNGLPAVNVARPSRWGNHYHVGKDYGDGYGPYTAELAVDRYRFDTEMILRGYCDECVTEHLGREIAKLTGKNLACFCGINEACHADVLLGLANERTGHE